MSATRAATVMAAAKERLICFAPDEMPLLRRSAGAREERERCAQRRRVLLQRQSLIARGRVRFMRVRALFDAEPRCARPRD